jgi:hypothetical protein
MLLISTSVFAVYAKPDWKSSDDPKPGIDFSGEHFTLNILGKKNIGNGSYDNPDRHTIFVPLQGNTTILMHLGSSFGVLDGNGLDGECIFQMPRKQKNFRVFIVTLGKPMDGSSVEFARNFTFDNATNKWYYELPLEAFDVSAHKGKPKWMNVSTAFLINLFFNDTINGTTGLLYNGWLWQVPEELWEQSHYFWDLKGADRHIQVRFYPY